MASDAAELVAQKVTDTRAELARLSEGSDARAGVLLGLAGAFVVLSSSSFSWWTVPASVAATVSAVCCVAVFRPGRHAVLDVGRLRDQYLRAQFQLAQRHIIDVEVRLVRRQSRLLETRAAWLQRGRQFMVLALALLTMGTLVEHLGG